MVDNTITVVDHQVVITFEHEVDDGMTLILLKRRENISGSRNRLYLHNVHY